MITILFFWGSQNFPVLKQLEIGMKSRNPISKYSCQVNNILKSQYLPDTYGKVTFCTNVCCSYGFTILFTCFDFESTLHGIKQMYLATVEFE